jgi:hypothetical protein
MRAIHITFIIAFILLISGCSQRFQDTSDTLQEGFLGFEDVEVTGESLKEIPYATMYARINDAQRIFMVLAFAEINPETGNTRLKWLSSDKAMIVTENGRITKTLKLPGGNLSNLSSSNELFPPSNTNSNWTHTYDWQPGYNFGNQALVTSKLITIESIQSLLWNKTTQHIQETYKFGELDQSMHSDFWIDSKGHVVKSAQWLVPNKLYIELEILKPYEEQ